LVEKARPKAKTIISSKGVAMSFYEAKTLFESALAHVNADNDPKTWNMLSGLVLLSQSLMSLQSSVGRIETDLKQTEQHVRQLKNR
jgi:hypothetical protein